MAKNGFPNHFKDMTLAQMTHIVGPIRRGEWATPEWATERRMAVMEVTERLMEIHDQTRDSFMQESIRGWVGEIQQMEGIT